MISILIDRYGVGYHMVVTKQEHCNAAAVIQHVTSIVPGGKMVYGLIHMLCFMPHQC